MRPGIACATLTMLFFTSQTASAWNGPGHMTVAKVAYDELNDQERQTLHEILKHHPHYTTYLTKNKPNDPLEAEWAFLRASSWPDSVRPPKDWKPDPTGKPDPVWYHRPGDHYTNRPVFAKNSKLEFISKIQARPLPHDILDALKQRVAEFGLRTISPADKAIALSWLIHLVGDVHQPLHCATLYKESADPTTDFRTGDQGGNLIAIRVGTNKVKVRLHSYWDGLLAVTTDPDAEILDTKAYAEEAYKVATLAAGRVKNLNPRSSIGELKSGKDFKDWVSESHELADKIAYWDGKIAEIAVRAPAYPEPIPDTAKEEPAGYSLKASQVADQRGALAGYRLADSIRVWLK